MAINPMQRKSRNSFLLGMLVMLLIGGAAVGFLIYQMMGLQEKIAIKESKTGYVLLQDVQSGATLDATMVKAVKMEYTPSDALTLIDIDENQLKTKTALKKGVVLSADMVNVAGEETKKDTRVVEYNMVTLPAKLENGNYIDIRFTLPSGQDYIVVSKKEVLACDTNTIWIEVSEDEIMSMNNVIVESYIMTGSNLYATIYSEAGLQEASTPTYAISTAVYETFANSPNILQEAIEAYNQRAQGNEAANRQSIERQLSQYSADKKQNIEDKVEETREKTVESRLKYISELNASY